MNKSDLFIIDRLNSAKNEVKNFFPEDLQEEFEREAYIAGGCIYSIYNEQEPKDYDFFLRSSEFANRLKDYFLSLYPHPTHNLRAEIDEGKLKTFYHKGFRIVVTRNAISIGKYQIITRFTGQSEDVVREFDFKHNMFWFEKGEIKTLSKWDYLNTNQLYFNDGRPRDISGTLIRVHKFVERGMKITNTEMAKILRKLREVGFTERENEIIDNEASY